MVSSPLTMVDNLFQERLQVLVNAPANSQVGDFTPESHFTEKAFDTAKSLNVHKPHEIKPGSLVKIRCMVQASFDPELYLDTFESVDDANNHRQLHCGRYRDNAGLPEGRQIDFSSPKNEMRNRQTLYCVPVPAETEWVKKYDAQSQKDTTDTAEISSIRTESKRTRDDDDDDVDMDATETEAKPSENDNQQNTSAETAMKKTKEDETTTTQPTADANTNKGTGFDLNFPIKDETGPAVMVKFYTDETPKINQMIEILGVYDFDPTVAAVDFSDDPFGMEEELRAHHPPSSLISRVHCLSHRLLTHSNPLLPVTIPEQTRLNAMGHASDVRAKFVAGLTGALGGDRLAAEYVLMNILSGIHTRKDGSSLVLGKLPLNIHGPSASTVTQPLFTLLRSVLTAAHHLPLDLVSMEKYRMNPHKNPQTNRLDAGMLQLVDGTHLLIDECAMKEGHLKDQGIKNLKALAQAMQTQTLEFEFEYTPITFEIDVAMLVVSEGKSMFPVDLHVPLQAGPPPITMSFTEDMLNQFRSYITIARSTEYEISEEVREVIESDFVKMRQADAVAVKGETLHNLLVQARLMSQSLCQSKLSVDVWRDVVKLDATRRGIIAMSTTKK